MQKRTKSIIILTIIWLIAGILWCALQFLPLTEQELATGDNYVITSETPKTIELCIDKTKLPADIDSIDGVYFDETDIVCYQNEMSSVYLSHVTTSEFASEYVYLYFDLASQIPKQGGTIITAEKMTADYGTLQGKYDLDIKDQSVLADGQRFEDAVVLCAIITPESELPYGRFGVCMNKDIFEAAQDEISFVVEGFNEVSYEKAKR